MNIAVRFGMPESKFFVLSAMNDNDGDALECTNGIVYDLMIGMTEFWIEFNSNTEVSNGSSIGKDAKMFACSSL